MQNKSKSLRILIVINVDRFFLSHRLQVALSALSSGHEVHIASSLTQSRTLLQDLGFIVHPLEMNRSNTGPIGLIKLFVIMLHLFWKLRPDILHLVTIKPVLVGGAAARFSPVRGVVFAVSGLGHVFIADGVYARLRRNIVRVWYRFVLGFPNMRIIFQNVDDYREIASTARLLPDQAVIIPGSGVDLSEYVITPLPGKEPVVLMASRLLSTKGVREFVAAAELLRAEGLAARFWLAGDLDPGNPASIQSHELVSWRNCGAVELLGQRSDIPALMAHSHLVVLPSYYGEGLPKVLIEAAACGRAVITTDMPGCRAAIEPGITGVLVPVKDSVTLAAEIKRLVEDRVTCEAMGLAGRKRAEQLFDVRTVVARHLEIYQQLIGLKNSNVQNPADH
jgi:glycosyltransferase involved in cell wall biosynthesis